jgi:hypothetical protein
MVDSGVKTNKFRGLTYSIDLRTETALKAVTRVPSLLNPSVSNRFVFAQSKQILTQKFGSQNAALQIMKQDPSVLQEGAALEDKTAGQIKAKALAMQLSSSAVPAGLIVAVLGIAVNEGILPIEGLAL